MIPPAAGGACHLPGSSSAPRTTRGIEPRSRRGNCSFRKETRYGQHDPGRPDPSPSLLRQGRPGGIMADYAADARIFTPDGVVRGSTAIRPFFARVFEEFVKPGPDFHMLREEVDGDTAYIVWQAETPASRIELATDTFIVKDGQIVTQTFAAKVAPR